MYGMIHRGIRQMVIDKIGQSEWDLLERSHGGGPEEYISHVVYDDEFVTQPILAMAAERLHLTIPECLEEFGLYWVKFAERGGYGSILKFLGNDIEEFISNLDRMHQALLLVMPEALIPSFSVVRVGAGILQVFYRSEREGLEPMVTGLLRGVLVRFQLEGDVEQVKANRDCTEFIITYLES
jgi:hypothetical protein